MCECAVPGCAFLRAETALPNRQPCLMPRCKYYRKRCRLVAACCGEAVCCHRCHDERFRHKLPRSRLSVVICDICQGSQTIHAGNTCLQCGARFAAYFCSECGIANDDTPAQGYFHCDECGICRVGRDDDYFHCSCCDCCLKLDLLENHIHQPNCLDNECPVCLQPMFDSQQPADKLPCGHMAHLDCISSSDISRDHICGLCAGTSRQTRGCESSSMAAARIHREAGTCEGSTLWQPTEVTGEWETDIYTPEISNMLHNLAHVSRAESGGTTLQANPKRFRQLLEKAVLEQIQSTAAEKAAKGMAILLVVQLLHTVTSKHKGLELWGQQVTVDRVIVAGSVGQKTQVQGLFDIDLVAFLNLPSAVLSTIDVADPDSAQESDWMQRLRRRLYTLMVEEASEEPQLKLGPAAIIFTLPTLADLTGVSLSVDLLLAPNLTAGAGTTSDTAASQCKAVMAPLLTAANAKINGSSSSSARWPVRPSYTRTVWLAESYTDFCRSAAAADGKYGRVVTTTMRLVKAWIRKGLQPRWPGFKQFKSFVAGLLVLKAAAQLPTQRRAVQAKDYKGRYVLDLLLLILDEVQCWAAAAVLSAYGEEVEPVLFTDMAHEKYYSEQQAAALQAILREQSPQDLWDACRGQPVVVHPIDPLCSVFNQQVQFELWEEFGQAAAELAHDLRRKSWKYICTQSTLAHALTDM